MNDFFDQLPTPPREMMFRWIWYIGAAALGLAAFLVVMPFVNHALALGLQGVTLIAKLLVYGGLTAVGGYVAMNFWEPFKLKIESLARQTTIAQFGEDPITPLHMWLDEVRHDSQVVERNAHEIGGIVAENDKVEADNIDLQKDADKLYAAAVKRYGEDSSEARFAAIDAGSYKDRAQNAARINGPLKELYAMLVEVAETTRLSERQAVVDVETAETEWRAALKAEKAMDSAMRSLNKRSPRYVSATLAFDVIRRKYAGSFGQLRSLRVLSQQAINEVQLGGDVAQNEAFQRLREQSQKLLGYSPAALAHDFSQDKQAVLASSSGDTAADLNLFDNNKN